MAQELIDGGLQDKINKQIYRDPPESHNPITHDARIRDRIRKLPPLPFRSINRFGTPGFEPGLQRHHILPLQLLAKGCFARMLEAIGFRRRRFDDFRSNGLLLPASGRIAILMGLPLHRGPHRAYNDLVIERVGQIEGRWAINQACSQDEAGVEAFYRLELLQNALRRRLLDPRGRRFALNRLDPAQQPADFSEIDAMIEGLWSDTSASHAEKGADLAASSDLATAYSVASLSTRSATDSTLPTAPMPCPDPQMSFQAFTPVLPPEPKFITLGSL